MQPLPADTPTPFTPSPLVRLVAARIIDAELAALLWVLIEARTPVVVAGGAGSGRRTVVDALAAALSSGAVVVPVAGDDEFVWLSQAEDLGWRRSVDAGGAPGAHADHASAADAPAADPPAADPPAADPPAAVTHGADPRTGVLLALDLADAAAGGPDGGRARIVVRALTLGFGMLATMPGDGLDDVLERLHAPAIGTDEDERSRLGVVLVMAAPEAIHAPRVVAAHYVRPVALDTHGHVQRLPPAVLATWNERADRWDHFAWGLLSELAGRIGRAPRDLEREQARRAASLSSAAAGIAGTNRRP